MNNILSQESINFRMQILEEGLKSFYRFSAEALPMVHIAVVITVLAAMLVLSVYSSSMFLFVEGEISGGITCSPQGNGKTYCCASVYDKEPNYGQSTTYCTTCDDTNPPSNCSEREKPLVEVNPGKVLSKVLEGGVLEEPKTQPKLSDDVFPKGQGVLEQEENNNTFTKSNVPSPLANDSDDD